jgi:hypothetical protein
MFLKNELDLPALSTILFSFRPNTAFKDESSEWMVKIEKIPFLQNAAEIPRIYPILT